MALDAAELEACYQRIERGLYNVLLRLLWDPAACQDLMQDTFLRLWAQRQRLHAGELDALAYTTAINLARNRQRWSRLWQWIGLDALDATAADASALDADLLGLRAALAELPVADRELILLSEFGGFDTAQLAHMLAIAPGTVGSRKHRALHRLRALMQWERGDER